jgi:hypothetical protein
VSPSRLNIYLTTFRLRKFAATCSEHGWTLRFAPFNDVGAPEAVEDTIAHELAHAFRYATNAYAWGDTITEETEVRKLVGSWGFKADEFREEDYAENIEFDRQMAALQRTRETRKP